MAGATKLNYRVGAVDNTPQASKWVQDEFGINPNQLGNLNPGIVRQMAISAQDMQKQVAMAKVFVNHAKQIMAGKVEIEKLRAELIKEGLANKETIDDVVKQIILLTEKHKGHIQKMMQEMMQGKALIGAETRSALDLSKSNFENKLRELAANHKAKLGDQREGHRLALSSINLDRNRSRQERQMKHQFDDYINGRDVKGNQWAIGGGRSIGGGRRGALGGLFS